MGSKVKGYRCKKCGRQVNVDYKKIKDRINPKCPACFEPIDMS